MKEIVIKKGVRANILVNGDDIAGASSSVYRLSEGSRLDFVFLGLPSSPMPSPSNKFLFLLDGDGATLNFFGLIYGGGTAVYEISTESRCLKRRCTANFNIKSALFDRSKVNFTGDMVIEKDGHESDCFLSHKTLLLSEHARTKTIPALEIKANDVKAGHAATIGKIDSEDLFYLNSRGIDDKIATEMIVRGFFESLLAMIADEQTRQKTEELLNKNL